MRLIRRGRPTGPFPPPPQRRLRALKDRRFPLGSSHRNASRDSTRAGSRVPLEASGADGRSQTEKAFLVGLEVRSKRGKGSVPAHAAAARDAAAMGAESSTPTRKDGPVKSRPVIPEFDADESLAELRALAES